MNCKTVFTTDQTLQTPGQTGTTDRLRDADDQVTETAAARCITGHAGTDVKAFSRAASRAAGGINRTEELAFLLVRVVTERSIECDVIRQWLGVVQCCLLYTSPSPRDS